MAYGIDLLWVAVYLWYFDDRTPYEISQNLFMSVSTVRRVIARFKADLPLRRLEPRQRRCDTRYEHAELMALKALVQNNATLYLDELRDAVHRRTGTWASLSTVCRALKNQLHITRKMLHKRAREACELLRSDFIVKCLNNFCWDQYIWIDESSVDRRSHQRRWGRSLRGTRTGTTLIFVRGIRHSVLPIMTAHGVLDWYITEGSIGQDKFNEFVELNLIPLIEENGGFPGPRSVVVLDNFSTHKNVNFMRRVDEANGVVLHLPPYSPDFNPIESVFGQVKAWLRRNHDWVQHQDGVQAIDRALRSVTPQDCQQYIRNACRFQNDFYLQR
mmetsp:Transcript_34176/g.54778  ORF Transcript_34176/g.54778 Transcript_34176/m.54778 type:complete len:330 (-) Transcript_34176:968-1957(-)|eukprot:CAMPEP_0198683702 /NCGR_PEP_ID=MMETSP1468-20131203/11050_1 /TAXON_ID=1461545 /ORGANISM="Mantoniella sp, Strain CCMP1436" /LENGTH=329 /DNA_ID=CAMNT_0044427911 /DNA_START=513 /DNA_END=1502 /DNA_ORIENTATION=-